MGSLIYNDSTLLELIVDFCTLFCWWHGWNRLCLLLICVILSTTCKFFSYILDKPIFLYIFNIWSNFIPCKFIFLWWIFPRLPNLSTRVLRLLNFIYHKNLQSPWYHKDIFHCCKILTCRLTSIIYFKFIFHIWNEVELRQLF